MRTFVVECVVERTTARRRSPRRKTRIESPGRTPKGARGHDIYRSPEAGAQVQVLPGASPVTCGYYAPRLPYLSDSLVSWTQMWHGMNPRSVPRRSSAAHRGVLTAASWRVSAARRQFWVRSVGDVRGRFDRRRRAVLLRASTRSVISTRRRGCHAVCSSDRPLGTRPDSWGTPGHEEVPRRPPTSRGGPV
jgi:hypothetical protein